MADNKAVYRRFMEEVILGGNLDLIDDLVDEKFVEHEVLAPGIPEGREGLHAWVEMMRTGVPDVRIDIEDMVEDGDNVWARFRVRGTHTGEFLGLPPTGKPFEITGIDIVKFQDGRAVEHWGVTDTASMLMQIGVLEAPQA